jgi:hypothetical protein
MDDDIQIQLIEQGLHSCSYLLFPDSGRVVWWHLHPVISPQGNPPIPVASVGNEGISVQHLFDGSDIGFHIFLPFELIIVGAIPRGSLRIAMPFGHYTSIPLACQLAAEAST